MADGGKSFAYVLKVHQLRPWPMNDASPQYLALGWQRGQQTGCVDAVKPKVTAKGYSVYQFNEEIAISARLRKSSAAAAAGYDKKFLQLALISVSRGSMEDKPIASVGTVVINLADFTDQARGPKKLAFRVSVGKEVNDELVKIGKQDAPSLIMTMQAKELSEMLPLDQESSFSSRGSRMTTDLSAFFSAKRRTNDRPTLAAEPSQGSTIPKYPSVVPSDPPRRSNARVDSDGFEIDEEEDEFHSAQGLQPSGTPAAGGRKWRSSEPGTASAADESPAGPPPNHKRTSSAQGVLSTPRSPGISSSPAPPDREQRRSRFSLLEEHAVSKRNRLAAIRSSSFMGGASAFDSGFELNNGNSLMEDTPVAENGTPGSGREKVRNLSGKRYTPNERVVPPEPQARQPRAAERKVTPTVGSGKGRSIGRSPEVRKSSPDVARSPDKLFRSRTPDQRTAVPHVPKGKSTGADGKVLKQRSLETASPTRKGVAKAVAKVEVAAKPRLPPEARAGVKQDARSAKPVDADRRDVAVTAKKGATPVAMKHGTPAAKKEAAPVATEGKARSVRQKETHMEMKGIPGAGVPPVAPRRKTGKTTFIKDWLGSAEPAPGEGPSIMFARDDTAQKPLYGKRTQPRRLSSMDEDKEVEDEEEEEGRRDLAHNLSVSRNYDLRMVLEKERIEKESESFMRDLEDVEEAAEEAAAALEEAKTMPMRAAPAAIPEPEAGSIGDSPAAEEDQGAEEAVQGEEDVRPQVEEEEEEEEEPQPQPVKSTGRFRGRGMAAAASTRAAVRSAYRTGSGIQAMSAELSSPDSGGGAAAAPARKWKGQDVVLEDDEFLEPERSRHEESAELMSGKLVEAPANGLRQEDIYSPDAAAGASADSRERAEGSPAAAHDAATADDAAAAAAAEAAAEAAAVAADAAGLGDDPSMVSAPDTGVEVVSACEEVSPREVSPAEMQVDPAMESISATESMGGASGPRARDGLSSKRSGGRELKWRRASAGGSAAGLATMNSAMDEADMKRAQQVPGLEQELRILGILETSVYACNCFKAPGGEARRRAHVTHTPARRLFRALLATPQDEARALVPVILAALRRRAVDEWWEDITQAFFWWSNVQMLRLFLAQLDEGTVMTVGDFTWLRPEMDDGLLELSEEIYNNVVNMLWQDVVLPILERSSRRKGGGDNAQEDAMLRWIAALDVAEDRLARAFPRVEGLATLLLPLLQAALVARLDFLFYENIMSVGRAERPPGAFGGEGGWLVPPKMLPFTIEGRVSFQTGMQLKMAVMHISHWTHDHDLKDREDAMLYPYTRSVADALMMKKDLLLDDETRQSIAAALPPQALLHLLENFAPDEFADSPVDAAVLHHLKRVVRETEEPDAAVPRYASPTLQELEEAVEGDMAQLRTRRRARGQSAAQFLVQIGDDSDAELAAAAEERAGAELDGGARFKLVQQLWGAAHDRRDE